MNSAYRKDIPKADKYNSPMIDRYAAEFNMQHKHRGMAIIFNHKNFDPELNVEVREGTEKDCLRLEKVLQQLRFEVHIHNDFCLKKIMETIEDAAAQNHDDSDCILVTILSHGNEGYIAASDSYYKLSDLCDCITPTKCPSLAGKPKLFFVQACQGGRKDQGVTLTGTDSNSSTGYTIPLHADFLIARSTVRGFVSWRNIQTGSFFIQNLCAELEANGNRLDLLTMLTFVCRRVAVEFESCDPDIPEKQVKQMPSITTMLTRNIYFRS